MGKTASDHLLAHWTHSVKPSEGFSQLTRGLLGDMELDFLSEEEFRKLEGLLVEGESDLVYRYLDLQLFYRTLDEHAARLLSIELEKTLEDHYKNRESSRISEWIALRSMENLTGAWLEALGLNRPIPVKQLSPGNFGAQMKGLIAVAMKESGFQLVPSMKVLLEAFLEECEEGLEYWNRICVSFEQLLLWEGAIEDLLMQIDLLQDPESENLEERCFLLEKELFSFHHHLSKQMNEVTLKNFSEIVRAGLSGRFRRALRNLNLQYCRWKSKLFNKPIDLHLCCTCDFCEDNSREKVIDLSKLKRVHDLNGPSTASLLIFTCAGGQGHLSVARAMSEYGIGKYHIDNVNTLEDTLASTDLFKRLLFNFSQERLYNHLLRNEGFEWIKLLTTVGIFFFLMQQESIEKQIRLEVLRKSPDLLISCFPCLNPMFLNVAAELNIPLLMVTTDLDTNFYTKGMNAQTCDLDYEKWKITLAFETPEMRAVLEKRIPPEKIQITGFPLRSSFKREMADTEKETLYRQFGIKENDRVLMVMIGGVACRATEKYAQALAELSDEEVSSLTSGNFHVICLCGNQKLPSNLEMRLSIDTMMPKSGRIRMHGVGSMENIAALMSISDGLITKPGGCTVGEAIEKKLPMIFHAPFALMDWEVFNMEFCIQAGIGSRFKLQSSLGKTKQRLLPLIREAFERKENLPEYSFERKDFGEEFLKLVQNMLAPKRA